MALCLAFSLSLQAYSPPQDPLVGPDTSYLPAILDSTNWTHGPDRRYYFYDSLGNLVTEEIHSVSVVNFHGLFYTYHDWLETNSYNESRNLLERVHYEQDSGSINFHPSWWETHTYDDQDRLVLRRRYAWNPLKEIWAAGDSVLYQFDSTGHQTLYAEYSWDSSEVRWIPEVREEYAFKETGWDTIHHYFEWDSDRSRLVELWQEYFRYDSAGNQLEWINCNLVPLSDQWDWGEREIRSYDSIGNQTLSVEFWWSNDDQKWNQSGRTVFNYDSLGNLAEMIRFYWDDQVMNWFNDYRTLFTFDSAGLVKGEERAYWDQEQEVWANDYRSVIILNQDGSRKKTENFYWDMEIEDWFPADSQQFEYNPLGLLTVHKTFSWDWDLNRMAARGWTERTYNDWGKLLEQTDYVWYRDSAAWVLEDSFKAYWSELRTPGCTGWSANIRSSSEGGDSIEIASSENRVIYLVPANTVRKMEVIRSLSLDSVSVEGHTSQRLQFKVPFPGTYWLYAIDTAWNLCGPLKISLFTDTAPPVVSAPDTVWNADTLGVSSSESGMIYLVPGKTVRDLRIIRSNCIDSVIAVFDSVVNLILEDLQSGTYRVYARDNSDNLSEYKVVIILVVGTETKILRDLHLYPNPVHDILTIQKGSPRRVELEICSLDGKKVYANAFSGSVFRIDLSAYPKGLYILNIRLDGFVINRKVIRL